MTKERKNFGQIGENLASRYLESRGYEIVDRNYRKPWGEIDIIAFKDDVCVFVEVKANSKQFKGDFDPELRVDERKLSKIIKTAELYMADDLNKSNYEWRVDIVSVTLLESENKVKIRHFKNVTSSLF